MGDVMEATVTMSVQMRDIEQFALEEMSITLSPYELSLIDGIVAGKRLWLAKRSSVKLARQVLEKYVQDTNGYIKHFQKTHFIGATMKGFMFLYCPVGNLCSWQAGDVEHRYCAYCKKGFEEMVSGAPSTKAK